MTSRPGEVVITKEQALELDEPLSIAQARLTALEVQDLVMKAYRMGRLHERIGTAR